MSNPTAITPPGERFNFAQHLLEANASRPGKPAFIDDLGALTYGQLAERVGRVAAGLRALGLRREERLLLLMHDCNDWPVSFLGAMYAVRLDNRAWRYPRRCRYSVNTSVTP